MKVRFTAKTILTITGLIVASAGVGIATVCYDLGLWGIPLGFMVGTIYGNITSLDWED